MIIKGTIFKALRHSALMFYPQGCNLLIKDRTTFSEWVQKGTYFPVDINNKNIVFDASPEDVSSIFISDIEFILNKCFEHLQECICFTDDNRIRSDAWNVVTIYYFAFFSAQGITRLIGSPILYLPKETIRFFKSLFGKKSNLGGGTYILKKESVVSASNCRYILKPTKNKVHEATWKNLFESINAIIDDLIKSNASLKSEEEFLFFQALTNKVLFKHYSGYQWPSAIRNKANYLPGFAYLLVENQLRGKTKKLFNNWNGCDGSEFHTILNRSISSCISSRSDDFSVHVCLLHDLSMSFFILFRELYFELLNRRRLDRRMEHKRKRFIRKMQIPSDSNYPFFKAL